MSLKWSKTYKNNVFFHMKLVGRNILHGADVQVS